MRSLSVILALVLLALAGLALAPDTLPAPYADEARAILPTAIAGMALLLAILLVAISGPWVYPADPFEIRAAPLTPPFGEDAWLGTDYLGRDVLEPIA